ncbi:hypothetical protein IFM89_005464, partial [Coptis chinensis]
PNRERQEAEIRPPKQKITDPTELSDYRLRKRKEYEDLIRRVRWNIGVWIKYAQWEESQKDFARARSVWERALEVDYRNHTLWLKYAEVEMENKFINHARNVWDRAVSLLPRIGQLWYKYIHMEEILGNVAGARQVFERYAKFEMKNGELGRCRYCYERAIEKLADDEEAEVLFVAFAEFEERCKETERARCIYKFALDHIPKGRAEDLYRKYVAFEKQFGDKEGIEDAIVGKRRFQYEEEVRKSPLNYDTWFDYIRLEESGGKKDRIREVYERAIANIPPAEEKRYWQRYIYLWINYALYEELDAEDMERTREVYRECLKLIPHSKFSFAKIWLLAAQFEIRQKNIDGARKLLGNAIGRAPKDKAYIDFEISEGEYERTRQLYQRLLDRTKHLKVWISFAKFEATAGLEGSDVAEENDQALLLEQRKQCLQRARSVFENAVNHLRTSAPELKEERAMLLEEWLTMESSFGNIGDVSIVQNKLPKKLKKRREIVSEDGATAYWVCSLLYEEYYDYIFPEETAPQNLKILDAAYKWKKQKFSHTEE